MIFSKIFDGCKLMVSVFSLLLVFAFAGTKISKIEWGVSSNFVDQIMEQFVHVKFENRLQLILFHYIN